MENGKAAVLDRIYQIKHDVNKKGNPVNPV
jgi:hypothetical protein